MARGWWAGATILGGIAGLSIGAHSTLIAPRQLKIQRRLVAIPGLPAAFEGYRVLHISDTHLGGLGSGAEQVLVVARLRPDLIVHTGDMIESGWYSEACAFLLGSLQASDGVVCVLGNHDYVGSWPSSESLDLVQRLRAHGVTVLINTSSLIERDGARLWLIGLDDLGRGHPDAWQAFSGIPPEDPVIVLAHSPDSLFELPRRHVALALTGHTHGGQVRAPWGAIVTRTRHRYPDVRGLQTVNGIATHMSAGLGSTVPIRLFCPPEATVLHLVRGE